MFDLEMKFGNVIYCGVWPIKYRQGSKTNKSNCRFWKKPTYDWLVEDLSQYLFGQRQQSGYLRVWEWEIFITKNSFSTNLVWNNKAVVSKAEDSIRVFTSVRVQKVQYILEFAMSSLSQVTFLYCTGRNIFT
jgi:hypothetical protein